MSAVRKQPTYMVPVLVTLVAIPLVVLTMQHAAWYGVVVGIVVGVGVTLAYCLVWFARYSFGLDGAVHSFLVESTLLREMKERPDEEDQAP